MAVKLEQLKSALIAALGGKIVGLTEALGESTLVVEAKDYAATARWLRDDRTPRDHAGDHSRRRVRRPGGQALTHGRDSQLHAELRPAASGGARRAAPGAGTGRRGDYAR